MDWSPVPSAASAEAVAHAYVQAMYGGAADPATILADECVARVDPGNLEVHRQALAEAAVTMRSCFPDGKVDIERLSVDGRTVTCDLHFWGTHQGSIRGHPATNRRVDIRVTEILRVEGEYVAAVHSIGHPPTLIEQLGLAPNAKTRHKAGSRQPEIKRSRSQRLFARLDKPHPKLDLAITLWGLSGLSSDDPKRQRQGATVMALQTRDAVIQAQERQSRSVAPSLPPAPPPPPDSASRPKGEPRTEGEVLEFLDNVQRLANEQPPGEALRQYTQFAVTLGLSGAAASFAVGAAHLGYSVRRAEEALDPDLLEGSPTVMRVLRGLADKDASATSESIRLQGALAFAERQTWSDTTLDVMTLGGPVRSSRYGVRDGSLTTLTGRGASFRVRPQDISADEVDKAWAFGYAARCVERAS